MHKRSSKDGFTLIELSLSIVFIAMLSIAVALIITNSIASYRRGLTLNSLNTTGMEVVDDMRAAIQSAPIHPVVEQCGDVYDETSFELDNCVEDNGLQFVSLTRKGKVKVGQYELDDVPLFGAFCTGGYSYIWNTGYFYSQNADVGVITDVAPATFRYKDGYSNDSQFVSGRLLKIKDPDRYVCVSVVRDKLGHYGSHAGEDYYYSEMSTNEISDFDGSFDISGDNYPVLEEDPVDILAGTGSLALYDLSTAVPVNGENSIFYSVSFILGTIEGGINVRERGDFCATPNGYNSEVANFDYCAINKFNFAAQATGG